MSSTIKLKLITAMLRDTDMTMETIARRIGDKAPGAIYRQIKKEFGVAPGTYRQQHRSPNWPHLPIYTKRTTIELVANYEPTYMDLRNHITRLFRLNHPGDKPSTIKVCAFTIKDIETGAVYYYQGTGSSAGQDVSPRGYSYGGEENFFTFREAKHELQLFCVYDRFYLFLTRIDDNACIEDVTVSLDVEITFNQHRPPK